MRDVGTWYRGGSVLWTLQSANVVWGPSTTLRTGLGGGMHLGAALYCPPFVLEPKDQGYRTVLGTEWSQRQVVEFETEDEATAEADAQIRRREKRGYKAVAW